MKKDQKERHDITTESLDKQLEFQKMIDEKEDELKELFIDYQKARKEEIKEIKKELKENPDDLALQIMLTQLTTSDNFLKKNKIEKLIKKAHKKLVNDGVVDDDSVGDYWLIFETRPYLIARNDYLSMLLEFGMIRKAQAEAEDIIRLNENDNMGVRYRLMHIYAALEDEESALKLVEKFDLKYEVEMLMALSILYFKLDDIKKAKRYLIQAANTNEFVFEFIDNLTEDSIHYDEESPVLQDSMEQLEYMYVENTFLYDNIFEYIFWAYKLLGE